MHLHNHTHYSVLDGLQKVPEMLDNVKASGMKAVAMTDHGTLSGVIEFYKEAKKRDIKPIIGIETYVASRSHRDKDPVKDKGRFHLILLAMNNKGYENLMELSSIANIEGYYYKPRIDHALLEKYNEGLICLSGCIGGEVGENLRYEQDEKAYEIARLHKGIFGDRYYIEVQDHGHPEHTKSWDEQIKVNKKLLKLAEDLKIPAVVTCDAHYATADDQEAHEILLCVQTASFVNDKDRFSLKDFDLFVAKPEDIIKRWGKENPELITNTGEIADRCNVEIELGTTKIPKFEVPKGQTEKSYIEKLVYQGLADRIAKVDRAKADKLSVAEAKKVLDLQVVQRADFELGVINKAGFNGYMLIVQDFINWGKDQGIIFGPGRGSAAGSIVSYGLRISDLNPLKYGLLFERFLNLDRINMPDIDIDIQDSRRDEVIEYCSNKYGADRVANIVTFGRMAARAAVRDVARVLEVPYAESDRMAKLIPPLIQGRHVPLKKCIEDDTDLKHEYENNPTAKKVFDLAARLEGTIRSHGVHAAGVVIAPDTLTKFIPLEMAQKGVIATQYPFKQVDELGLLKIDFLGLSNLTTINNALRIIKKVYNEDIEIEDIPLDNLKTYELLQRAQTTGVFQLESAGMKRYLKELSPTVFEDIISMVALYRPGPMQWIDDFIDRKHGRKAISYMHPAMQNALEPTYGIIVTQEQAMQISKDMCGFTGGQADTLRYAIGKKIPELMAKMKTQFIDGAIKTVGADRQIVEKLWGQLEDFAAYCFNKAHSACYATIAYWTAYLKANYPDAFMAALMTSDQNDLDRLSIEISECGNMGIQVLLPDVNESYGEFAVVPGMNQIRFGMNAVKNVGHNAVEEILRVREQDGEFKSIEDFLKRVNVRIVNRKNIESLIKAGAFDSLGDRNDLVFNVDNLLSYASKLQKEHAAGQTDLFGGLIDEMIAPLNFEISPTKISEGEMLQWERDLLGLYLSAHPLDSFESYFSEQTVKLDQLSKNMDGKVATIGGAVLDIRVITTKNGGKMAFVKMEDKTATIEIIVFPNLFTELGERLTKESILKVKGKLNAKDRDGHITNDLKIIADDIVVVTKLMVDAYKPTGKKVTLPKAKSITETPKIIEPKKLYLQIVDPQDHNKLVEIKKILSANNGDKEVILVLGENKSSIRLPFKVDTSENLIAKLETVLNKECVVLK